MLGDNKVLALDWLDSSQIMATQCPHAIAPDARQALDSWQMMCVDASGIPTCRSQSPDHGNVCPWVERRTGDVSAPCPVLTQLGQQGSRGSSLVHAKNDMECTAMEVKLDLLLVGDC